VQWELQEEWRVDRRFLEPFAHFVAAAAERRTEGRPKPPFRRTKLQL
jgi:hypothetical protein